MHYLFKSNFCVTEAVLDCWWMTGVLKCFENPGYKFNTIVNTQLTLNISHLISIFKGTYACQIAGYKPSSFGKCQLETGHSNDGNRNFKMYSF